MEKKIVALGVIGIGAYYLWTSGALAELSESLGLGAEGGSTVALTPAQRQANELFKASAQVTAVELQEDAAGERARSGIGAYTFASAGVGSGAAIAGAASLGTMGALAATGVGAVGALVVWGITQQGWGRGGEEGIRVNPARDAVQNEMVKVYFGDPFSFSREEINEKRYWAMVYMLRDGANGGVHGETASQIIAQLYAADTMNEFEVAITRFLRAVKEGV